MTHTNPQCQPREIELRKMQYAHYRDMLLGFLKPKEAAA